MMASTWVTSKHGIARWSAMGLVLFLGLGLCWAGDRPAAPEAERLQGLLQRMGDQMTSYVEKFSDVKCTEMVTQEKFKNDTSNKVELKAQSSYDYLVILTNTGGGLNFLEYALEGKKTKR